MRGVHSGGVCFIFLPNYLVCIWYEAIAFIVIVESVDQTVLLAWSVCSLEFNVCCYN